MAKPNTDEIDLSAGMFIRCLPVDDWTTHIQVPFKHLKVITHDPVVLQSGNAKQRPTDVTDEDIELHSLVQRGLELGKKTNIPKYAAYIQRHVTRERAAVLPPIHLWTEHPLSIVQSTHQGALQNFLCVPHGLKLIAIDGETQLASHYHLERSLVGRDEERKQHADAYLSAVVHDNRTPLEARQFFYDLNVLGVRVNSAIALSMDTADPLMEVVGRLSEEIPFFRGKVERISRQIKKNSPKVVKLQDLRQFVVNMVHGIAGVQYGTKPAPVDHVDLADLESAARDWLSAYSEAFAEEIADREQCVAAMGSVLAAVGAMGRGILEASAEDRADRLEELLDSLRKVDWRKGDHWLGTVLTKTPQGKYTINGPKQSAYAVFGALSDPESPAYAVVRGEPASPAL
ncbi:DNA sulfur modification protein DndB [Streptomyces sp. NPDC048270]|uniref:DNA sulfur modification protein DndB n=1 Tax=Streptomyces sp. NPDC048270 TaxID=3154615 RepID=UPI0033E59586